MHRLRHLKDGSAVNRKNESISEMMGGLIEKMAKDMKDCGNACDVYTRKTAFTKIVTAPAWNNTLAAFVMVFKENRDELIKTLSLFTAVSLSDADSKLDAMGKQLQEIQSTLKLFSQALSPEQRSLQAYIEKKGGQEMVINDDNTLLQIQLRFEGSQISKSVTRGNLEYTQPPERLKMMNPALHVDQNSHEYLRVVKFEVNSENLEDTITKNKIVFGNKFELLERNLELAIKNSTNTLLVQMKSGAHDQVEHPVSKVIPWTRNAGC